MKMFSYAFFFLRVTYFYLLHLGIFWDNIYMWYEVVIQIHPFACGYPIVPAPFFKIYSVIIKFSWHLCQKFIDHNIRVCFWALNYVPLTYMPISMALLLCLDYCSFVWSFETRNCKYSNHTLFKEYFSYSVSFEFLYQF